MNDKLHNEAYTNDNQRACECKNNIVKEKIIVLSLFDGISCGQVALERAGIKVEKYFASEIDKYAISITQKKLSEYNTTWRCGKINRRTNN